MDISSIDDLLAGGKTPTQPEAPEHQYNDVPEEIGEVEQEESPSPDDYEVEEEHQSHEEEEHDNEEEPRDKEEPQEDEYGNKKELMSKNMQKRMKKLKEDSDAEIQRRDNEIMQLRAQLAQGGASKNVQQAAQDFEFDPNDEGSWQEQFAQMVRQTIAQDEKNRIEKARQHEENQEAQAFRGRFQEGMNRFDDFMDVVDGQPVDEAMTLALRGVSDPAAFIYAAAKRMPQELERISKLKSPHDRYAEMIRLEGKMRTNKPSTSAPRPLGRAKEDANAPAPKKKTEDSIEDMIARSEAKKLAILKQRRGK